jgi:hypothetical protein
VIYFRAFIFTFPKIFLAFSDFCAIEVYYATLWFSTSYAEGRRASVTRWFSTSYEGFLERLTQGLSTLFLVFRVPSVKSKEGERRGYEGEDAKG